MRPGFSQFGSPEYSVTSISDPGSPSGELHQYTGVLPFGFNLQANTIYWMTIYSWPEGGEIGQTWGWRTRRLDDSQYCLAPGFSGRQRGRTAGVPGGQQCSFAGLFRQSPYRISGGRRFTGPAYVYQWRGRPDRHQRLWHGHGLCTLHCARALDCDAGRTGRRRLASMARAASAISSIYRDCYGHPRRLPLAGWGHFRVQSAPW